MNNRDRLLRLADEVFAVHDDPAQLQVDAEVLERLRALHPAAVGERTDGNGPIAWVLLIPTTLELMEGFLAGHVTEQELYERTPIGVPYAAVYLCSAMVLDEHRRHGIAKRMTVEALRQMRNDHAIESVFSWPFTPAGAELAQVIAAEVGLPLHQRTR